MTTVDHTQQQLQQDPISLTYTPTGRTRAHTYGHCYTSRTDPREARSQGVLVAERSATEFTEILYIQSTPMYRSHRITQHPHPPAGRTGLTNVSETPDEPLLHV